jgi:hypothetical protein
MYMLHIQVHKYFSDFGKRTDPTVEDDVEIDLHPPGTILLYYTLFSLYWD